ncbi:MAG: M48 family metallopeptidase [Gammaproteobacteria bacterium]|nr:M48 family metallopeptidase [Gammaproteobacteria bacterium]
MVYTKMLLAGPLALLLGSCASDGSFDATKATAIGLGALSVAALDEKDVKEAAKLSAKEMDSKSLLATEGSPYTVRLAKITSGLHNYAGLNLNFKVYIAKDVNAFAMADGTVRVYSGLMDAMPDDQVLAVIGHEIGHVKLKHSYQQMRQQMLTNTAFQAIVSVGGTIGELTSSELGAIAYQAVNARFSQKDELEADKFAVKMLQQMGKDPSSMLHAVETLEKLYGSGGGFLSSHPSNDKRKEELKKVVQR